MWWVLAAWAGPCEPTALSVSLGALDAAPDAAVAQLTAADLAGMCSFAPEVMAALTSVATDLEADAELRDSPVLQEGCPGLRRVNRNTLWRHCDLEATGLFTKADWMAAEGPLLLPLVVFAALLEGGIPPDTAQVATRRLAGIPRHSRSRKVDVFEPLYPTFP